MSVHELAGVTTLCHDGWWGVLVLGTDGRGQFVDARDPRRTYDAEASIDEDRGLALVVHRYDQQPRREFSGHAVGGSARAFAGTTEWRSRPFGFYVRHGPYAHSRAYGRPTDQVERDDFLGSYTLWSALGRGTLDLVGAPGGVLARYTTADDEEQPVRIRHDALMDGVLAFEIGTLKAHGYLFRRTKNAVAGTAELEGRPSGFYMTRFR